MRWQLDFCLTHEVGQHSMPHFIRFPQLLLSQIWHLPTFARPVQFAKVQVDIVAVDAAKRIEGIGPMEVFEILDAAEAVVPTKRLRCRIMQF